MRKFIIRISAMLCFLFLLFLTFNKTMMAEKAGSAPEYKEMKNVKVKKISDTKSDVIIQTTGLVKYRCFKIESPPKLVVDITGIKHSWDKKNMEVDNPLIKKVRTSQFQDEPEMVVRVVLDLSRQVSYEAESTASNIIITVFSEKGATEKKPEKRVEKKVEKKPVKKAVKKKPAVKKQKNTEDIEHKRLVEKIRKQEEEAALREKKKKGKPSVMEGVIPSISDEIVNLNFYQADITEVMRMLSEQSGMNFIYGSDVSGTITLFLENVSFDDAFRAILKLSGLVAQKQSENIVRIVTPQQLKTERGRAVKITRKFTMKYTKADDIKAQLTGMEFGGVKANVSTDKTTNSLIITTTPEGLEEYQKIVNELDVMPRQVMIEARIMEIGIDDVPINLGVDWSVARDFNNRNNRGSGKDNLLTIGSTQDSSARYEGFDGNAPYIAHPGEDGSGVNFMENLTSAGGILRIGSILNQTRFNLTLAALSKSTKLKELSHPRIITLNNETAKVLVGDKIPVKEKSVSQGIMTESIKYLDTGIKLSVTPTINEDGYITLVVHPEISTFKADGSSYVISTREAETKVLVKDGDTIVIGGLIKDQEVKTTSKVPILGDIPILGILFRHKKIENKRTELLVFVTANIIKQLEE